jgi:SAM-dependent methyltransferase
VQLADRYERVPYPGNPFAALHPQRLAATARLFGLRTAPVDRCRVLEIGCARGGHLLPMAAQLPGSSFVGVDLAAGAIAAAREQAGDLGLANVRLIQGSFSELPDDGPFDYIVVHGVYSWIEPADREELLATCRRRLSAQGVALISYNTFPGWSLRGLTRGIMRLFPTGGPPEEEVGRARSVLDWAANHVPEGAPHAGVLTSERSLIARVSDAYLFHEHLAPRNDPVWFSDFAAAAAEAGLRYVGEARLTDMAPMRLGAAAAAAVAAVSEDLLVREQLMDVLQPRYFRRTLLCHRERELVRKIGWQQMTRLRFTIAAGGLEAAAWTSEEGPHRTLALATGRALAERAPQAVSFTELLAATSVTLGSAAPMPLAPLLGGLLLDALARGDLDAVVRRWRVVNRPGRRPSTSALVRWQASRGARAVTSQRHEPIEVDDLDRALLARLDGTRLRPELLPVVVEALGEGDAGAALEERLVGFARNGLLT